jgi:hypothetical protein
MGNDARRFDDADREALLDELARFATPVRGLVATAIVEPTLAFFPSAAVADARTATAVADALLRYAGLGAYHAQVDLADDAVRRGAQLPATRIDLAAIEDETVFFSCIDLGTPEDLVLALANEVARAALMLETREGVGYREKAASTHVEVDESEGERRRAAILATTRGLGLLVAKGAHVFRQTERIEGRNVRSEWRHDSFTQIAPREASFLLAVQLTVRGVSAKRIDALLAHLSTERSDEVREEIALLDRDALIERLALPAPSTWPDEEPPPDPPVTPPKAPPREPRPRVGKQRHEPTFRIQQTHRGAQGVLAGGVVAFLIAVAWARGVSGTAGDGICLFGLFAVFGGWLGWVVGHGFDPDDCSNCGRALARQLTRCEQCHREIGGRIRSSAERYDALERWKHEQRPLPAKRGRSKKRT